MPQPRRTVLDGQRRGRLLLPSALPSLVRLTLALCSGKAAHLSPLPLAHPSLRIWGKKEIKAVEVSAYP